MEPERDPAIAVPAGCKLLLLAAAWITFLRREIGAL